MNRLRSVRTIAIAAFALCLCVVVLGAYVRLSNAGLGCPDWPGCYGHLTPAAAAAVSFTVISLIEGLGWGWAPVYLVDSSHAGLRRIFEPGSLHTRSQKRRAARRSQRRTLRPRKRKTLRHNHRRRVRRDQTSA